MRDPEQEEEDKVIYIEVFWGCEKEAERGPLPPIARAPSREVLLDLFFLNWKLSKN